MSNPRRVVQLAPQVVSFLRTQAPDTRRRLRLAIRALEHDRGDIQPLEGALDGYHRVRVGAFRIIIRYAPRAMTVCVFAERRSMVYVLLENLLDRGLRGASS